MDAIQKELLMQVADLHEIPEGAYNIRSDGQMYGRNTTANIDIVTKTDAQSFGAYVHMGGKISVLALVESSNEELSKGLAMHIAANNPTYISTKDIPAEAVENEKRIQLEAAKNDEKLKNQPEERLVKIIEGKVNKVFSEVVLLSQEFLLEPGKKVEQVLKEKNATLVSFVRYAVGEGIAKREENFAEEVAKQTQQ